MDRFLSYEEIYSEKTLDLIEKEFSRTRETCYLDNVGSALYSEKQLENTFKELSTNIFANPHARNTSSKCTEDAIDIARHLVLQHFNTNSEEYSVIFTSGATESLKIIAENFDYGNSGILAYLQNNHTSVLGMRAYAPKNQEITVNSAFKHLNNPPKSSKINPQENYNCLFIYPSQSNFCGTKYPLTWVKTAQNGALNQITNCNTKNWYVVLDSATFCSTNILDLSTIKPDFIPISFYKLFGFPTGLGALLVHKRAEKLLKVKYLGGGTVLMALSSENTMIPRPNLHERFEAGTLPFLSILAIRHGFETIKRLNLNFDLISKHSFNLAQYVFRNLLIFHHSNGQPLVKLYHDTIFENCDHQGGIVNFNLLRDNGEYIGYSEVLHLANLYGIHLRTGCFCNPGACQKYLNLTNDDVRRHYDAGHVCGDQHDLINGQPTGSVRISFGYTSTKENADQFLTMIKKCFISRPICILPDTWERLKQDYNEKFHGTKNLLQENQKISANNKLVNDCQFLEHSFGGGKNCATLKKIFLFPVKSCGAFSVKDKWELTATGLKYDRQWMIINSTGICVTQKQIKKLCVIKPVIDLSKEVLILNFKGHRSVEIPLVNEQVKEEDASLCQSKVCGDRIQGWDCGDMVANWLSEVLEISGLRLLQQSNDEKSRTSKESLKLSLANKAQYLLLNFASIEWLRDKIPKEDFEEDLDKTVDRFRPNFVVDFEGAFQEIEFDCFLFDDLKFTSGGKCTRCQMICIDQSTGEVSKEPLASLSREFQGKISFGTYLNQENPTPGKFISIGSKITGLTL